MHVGHDEAPHTRRCERAREPTGRPAREALAHRVHDHDVGARVEQHHVEGEQVVARDPINRRTRERRSAAGEEHQHVVRWLHTRDQRADALGCLERLHPRQRVLAGGRFDVGVRRSLRVRPHHDPAGNRDPLPRERIDRGGGHRVRGLADREEPERTTRREGLGRERFAHRHARVRTTNRGAVDLGQQLGCARRHASGGWP